MALFLNLVIESGDISFSDSNIMWKDDLKIYLSESLLNIDQNEIYLIGKIVIDIKDISGDDIKFGATIEIQDDDVDKKHKYQIVGEYESDIENKKLSINSPLARGLIGKLKGDSVEINSPKGIKNYTIISVKYV